MLRIICYENDCGAAIHIGGPVDVTYRTFEVDAPEVEAYLNHWKNKNGGPNATYPTRGIAGVEVVEKGPQ